MEQNSSKDSAMWVSKTKNSANSIVLFSEQQKKEVTRLLSMKFKRRDGKLTDMFAMVANARGLQKYCCLLCSKMDMGVLKFINHARSKNHMQQFRSVNENSTSSVKNWGKIPDCGKVTSELQAHLNVINDQVLVGVEYILEVYIGNCFESIFHCVLCEGRFDRQEIVTHLTSDAHRAKYLKKHFHTAFKKLTTWAKREEKFALLERVCHKIESFYGRLSLLIVERNQFSASQMTFYERVLNGIHFDEKMGHTFAEFLDKSDNSGLSAISDYEDISSTCSLQSISTSSEFSLTTEKASSGAMLSPSASYLPSLKLKKGRESGDGSKSRDEKNMKHIDKIRDSVSPRTKFPSKIEVQQQSTKLSSSRQSLDKSRSPHRFTSTTRSCREPAESHGNMRYDHRFQSPRKSLMDQPKRSFGSDGGSSGSQLSSYEISKVSNDTSSATRFHETYSPIQTSVESSDEEPTTIISVLSLLCGFESLLGSLGPKMITLMTEAISMEKVCVNASNYLLDNSDYYIVFDTTKEKLNGYLRAGLVNEPNQRLTIKTIVDNMNLLICEADTRKQHKRKCEIGVVATTPHPIENHDRTAIAAKIIAAFNENGRADISEAELAQYVEQYVKMANAKQFGRNTSPGEAVEKMHQECNEIQPIVASKKNLPAPDVPSPSATNVIPSAVEEPLLQPTTLSDTNLTTLIKNFGILSDVERRDVIANIRDIEINDPERMKRLGNKMQIEKLLNYKPFKFKSEIA